MVAPPPDGPRNDMVVDTGMPATELIASVVAPAVSAAKPPTDGLVIASPGLRSAIRQTPCRVPSRCGTVTAPERNVRGVPIIFAAARISQMMPAVFGHHCRHARDCITRHSATGHGEKRDRCAWAWPGGRAMPARPLDRPRPRPRSGATTMNTSVFEIHSHQRSQPRLRESGTHQPPDERM